MGHNDDTLVDNNCDKVDTSYDDHKLVARMDQVLGVAYHRNQNVMTELIRVVRVGVDHHHQQTVVDAEQELVEQRRDSRVEVGTYHPVDWSYWCSYYY